jgi:hypothetical protein
MLMLLSQLALQVHHQRVHRNTGVAFPSISQLPSSAAALKSIQVRLPNQPKKNRVTKCVQPKKVSINIAQQVQMV